MQDLEFKNIYNPYYLLNDSKVYDKDKKDFVTEADSDYKEFLDQGNQPLSIGSNGYTYDQLINSVLKFYGWEIGECLLSLEQLKEKKLLELKEKADSFEENLNKNMFFTSSLGFKSDGDRRTNMNIQSLIDTYSVSQAQELPVLYWDYDNVEHEVSLQDLQPLKMEQIINGNNLYTQKKNFKDLIDNAKSIEELNQIDLTFNMMDFSINND